LKAASAHLETATDDISTLRDNLQEKIESLHQEKEIQLKIREKRCEDTKATLERQREMAENEKTRLLELIQALETQASLQTQTTAEHDWTVRQQVAGLEAERAAFQREKEFFRDRMKSDEKRIEVKTNNN
jgi:Fas-binding factor 1